MSMTDSHPIIDTNEIEERLELKRRTSIFVKITVFGMISALAVFEIFDFVREVILYRLFGTAISSDYNTKVAVFGFTMIVGIIIILYTSRRNDKKNNRDWGFITKR